MSPQNMLKVIGQVGDDAGYHIPSPHVAIKHPLSHPPSG